MQLLATQQLYCSFTAALHLFLLAASAFFFFALQLLATRVKLQ
jgi:hypothetical protein